MIRRLALVAALASALPAGAAEKLSLRDSFRIGTGGALCTAQSIGLDPALSDLFDRGYSITCRDAAAPVGRLYVLKRRGVDPAARLAALRGEGARCEPATKTAIEGVGQVDLVGCTLEGGLAQRTYSWVRGNSLFVAEGLAGYDSALRLGLRSLVADAPVAGDVEVAVTEAGDPAAFARVQAGSLDPAKAMFEGYRRNNGGAFAEASEFFATLARLDGPAPGRAEALVNQAVQQSNLGQFGEADRLFAEAAALAGGDAVVARMLRNYRAIDLLNRDLPDAALGEIAKPLPLVGALDRARSGEPRIDPAAARVLNAEGSALRDLDAAGSGLLPSERAQILDAQAEHLRGTLLRLGGRGDEARRALQAALAGLDGVRDGRVVSTYWMRAQILGELAAVAEAGGDRAGAERRHGDAIALLRTHYPTSPALLSAEARLAGFYARSGREGEARQLYRRIVDANADGAAASPSLRRILAPYFALLAREPDANSAAEMFKASQLLLRPGVAQTQAVLARELSGGSGEAARLFRQSVNLSREIERLRVETARLAAAADGDEAALEAKRSQLAALEKEQVATQSKLAEYPSYRVISAATMELTELQKILRPGEAYYKMTFVGDDGYALYATAESARAWKLGTSAAELERSVDALRATISTVEDGQLLTYPFDVELAHRLYGQLFGPVRADLAVARHLIFEPDGAMLRLPPNLLVTERSGVDAYLARARQPGSDGFDFTGVRWLGRDRDVSTAVSARAFRDVRQVAPSRARKAYLGLGENAPPEFASASGAALQTLLGEGSACAWPLTEWTKPISAAELRTAAARLGGAGEADIVTGRAFSDAALKARGDLAGYRILHFATHGLVTAPRPECAARPALMTSFGGDGSDGLLTFSEIYDLRLDADLVILSACDTAGKASLAATREAGLRTGGDFALDGLVRAFVGAGGRSVIASHWPVPDDFDATNRLISGLFTAPAGTSQGSALRQAQAALMDRSETSHPYYWSGFAIVGDASAPVLPKG
jgi:CHAT domain-containing protein